MGTLGILLVLASTGNPSIIFVGAASPDVLEVQVQTGRVVGRAASPYSPESGDKISVYELQPWVLRANKPIGAAVGPKRDRLWRFEKLEGAPWPPAKADNSDFLVRDGAGEIRVVGVGWKSKPTDLARIAPFDFAPAMRHRLYLRLGRPLKAGATYSISLPGNLRADWTFNPRKQRSESVMVSQIGFRPDDPAKSAFVSTWMGTLGPLDYPAAPAFEVLRDKDGATVTRGRATLLKAKSQTDEDAYAKNYAKADVYEVDFSSLITPGKYRVYVAGIGCSFPFEIAPSVWERAFKVGMKGFYHQRANVPLGPPYTPFVRPGKPDDVVASTTTLLESGNGLNLSGDKNNFDALVRGKTSLKVAKAWGGYHDAGDWDTRIQHLDATRLLLELCELFPAWSRRQAWNIPESGNARADLVDEALWNIDHYRRMQGPDGSIRGGIEMPEHPLAGETSWTNSLPWMAYAPDPWSSYLYAATAARAAYVLLSTEPKAAKIYRDSAERAYGWAERDLPRWKDRKLPHNVNDARNLASVELFRTTGLAFYNVAFLQTTVFLDPAKDPTVWQSHDQAEAAFVYARLGKPGMDATVKLYARNALLRFGDNCASATVRSGYRTARENPYLPAGWGLFTVPRPALFRAYFLDPRPEFLRAMVASCQFSLGANPDNLCYTTGLGVRSPQNPLFVDQRMTYQKAPAGITVLGPVDMGIMTSFEKDLLMKFSKPTIDQWPAVETYVDAYLLPLLTEYTVNQNLGPVAYAWGFLAARGK